MFNLFSRFRADKIWDFKGGIHPPEMKTQSNGTPLAEIPLPEQFILPLKQHIGQEGELLVKAGDQVLRGQPLTFGNGRMLPIHAPTSGTVTAIAPHMTAHPSGLSEPSVFIRPDGEDRWIERQPIADYQQVDRQVLITRIHEAGVAGLGGAGFPTATKLKGGQGVKTLIINAAECEPYITADDRLMQDCAAEILTGCRILRYVLQAEQVLIGIEDNKPEAIRQLKAALGQETDLIIRVIPTKYPSGGAKQLTRILTGREVPHGGRSADIGVLMQNVGTAYAVKRAVVDGEPLTCRVVTLTGESLRQPRNVWGRLGTPVSHLLEQAGFTASEQQMVIMGGPLMGFTLPSLDVPMVKITNCLLAPSASEMGEKQEEQSCIRCSACADACPAGLLPQQLYWYCQGGDHEKARAYNLNDCIECGACAYVCPSNIPLVQYYRQEKAELLEIDLEAQRTAEAKARFEARQQRLEREKQAREARHAEAKRRVSSTDQQQITAALERVKAKSAPAGDDVVVQAGAVPDNSAVIAQREARKAQAKARQAEKAATPASDEGDARKDAVAAAIARAKAKKAAQAADNDAVSAEPAAVQGDPRKAAVAAAIARAKAKKAAQAADNEEVSAEPVAVEEDPRKAAVAAAIARAKAKKAAQAADNDAVSAEPAAVEEDPRKAAVAAAIARAKAKKAAQSADNEAVSAEPVAVEDDPRKAAVAAAIARAKAKKAAQAADNEAVSAEPVAVEEDPRKAAVAAAIARAKAKKAAQAADNDAVSAEPAAVEDDPRKAAVAAAIARAKAKKAAQAADNDAVSAEPVAVEEDPRKAAVAAAIARAKAKKAAQRQEHQPSATPELQKTTSED